MEGSMQVPHAKLEGSISKGRGWQIWSGACRYQMQNLNVQVQWGGGGQSDVFFMVAPWPRDRDLGSMFRSGEKWLGVKRIFSLPSKGEFSFKFLQYEWITSAFCFVLLWELKSLRSIEVVTLPILTLSRRFCDLGSRQDFWLHRKTHWKHLWAAFFYF